jgi:hypothetical protein
MEHIKPIIAVPEDVAMVGITLVDITLVDINLLQVEGIIASCVVIQKVEQVASFLKKAYLSISQVKPTSAFLHLDQYAFKPN